MSNPTASRAGLLVKCQWWARPEVVEPYQPKTAAMAEGTRVHKLLEMAIKGETVLPREGDAPLLEWLKGFWPRAKNLRPEVKFALNAVTKQCRELKAKGERDYRETHIYELPGTADMVWHDPDGVLHVCDLKTGNPKYLEPPGPVGQLGALAVMATGALGEQRARVSYLLFKSGQSEAKLTEAAELDAQALAQVGSTLRRALLRREIAEPVPNPDCWKCGAKPICPAWRKK